MLGRITRNLKKFFNSVWVFPVLVIILFAVFTTFQINGSSIGIYSSISSQSGDNQRLITGKPQPIRSDEWLVMTQMVIAQEKAGYPSTNTNIGNGQNMNLILDVPSKDWSQLFRPQNHAFIALPFENAFAYRWWFSAVILLISIYFLVLKFLPKRRLIATLLAVSTYFSGFVQWWYISCTLGSLGYSILAILLFIQLVNSKTTIKRAVSSALLSYTLTCFAIIIYPPFQIPCAIVALCFAVGYSLFTFRQHLKEFLHNNATYFTAILLIVLSVVGLYIYQNKGVVDILQNTAYPGQRIVESGGFSFSNLMSGQLAIRHLRFAESSLYKGASNQSESSTFIFVSFFLIIPYLVLFLKKKDYKLTDVALPLALSIGAVLALFFAWLFIYGLSILGAITALNIVPLNRLLIGLGLINLLSMLTFIFVYLKSRITMSKKFAFVYSILVFVFIYGINKYIQYTSPGFLNNWLSMGLALPVPIIIFLFLRKKFTYGLLVLAIFSFLGSAAVNPLYIGLSSILNNPLYSKIEQYPSDGKAWVSEDIVLENFASMAGKKNLSGVFFYPQKDLWNTIDGGKSEVKYNRYAHVTFTVDDNPSSIVQTGFADFGKVEADRLTILTEMCSPFMRGSGVAHVVSSKVISKNDQNCIKDIDPINMNNKAFYIYSLE